MEKGTIVRSIAGHDRDRFYLVVKAEADRVWIADGKLRKLTKPKAKNIRHIRTTAQIVQPTAVTTDKKLRELLKPYNGQGAANEREGMSDVQG